MGPNGENLGGAGAGVLEKANGHLPEAVPGITPALPKPDLIDKAVGVAPDKTDVIKSVANDSLNADFQRIINDPDNAALLATEQSPAPMEKNTAQPPVPEPGKVHNLTDDEEDRGLNDRNTPDKDLKTPGGVAAGANPDNQTRAVAERKPGVDYGSLGRDSSGKPYTAEELFQSEYLPPEAASNPAFMKEYEARQRGTTTEASAAKAPEKNDQKAEEDRKRAEADTRARDKQLLDDFDQGKKQTPEELARVKELKTEQEKTQGDRQTIEDQIRKIKEKPISQWSEEEIKQYSELTGQLEQAKLDELSEKDRRDETLKQLKATQVQAFEKMLNGDFDGAMKDIEIYNETLGNFLGMEAKADMKKQAEEFVNGIKTPDQLSPQESQRYKDIKEELQKLSEIELRLRSLAATIKAMNKQEKEMNRDVNSAERNYASTQDPDKKQQALMVYQGKVLQLARYQDMIREQKKYGRDSIVERDTVRGRLHWKLGTHRLVYNVAFDVGTGIIAGSNAVQNAGEGLFYTVTGKN